MNQRFLQGDPFYSPLFQLSTILQAAHRGKGKPRRALSLSQRPYIKLSDEEISSTDGRKVSNLPSASQQILEKTHQSA